MAPKDPINNPQLPIPPQSPSKGLFHQYPPVDLVDPKTHRVPEGGALVGKEGLRVDTEVISPNEFKAVKKAGIRAAVREATALLNRRQEALANMSDVPLEDAKAILEAGLSDADQINLDIAKVLLKSEQPPSCTEVPDPAASPLPPAEAHLPVDNLSATPMNIENWADDIPLQPDNPNSILADHSQHTNVAMSHTEITLAANNIHIDWDDLGNASYESHTSGMSRIIYDKLQKVLSEGKDSLLKAITDNNADDAVKILEAAEESMLVGAEGYSKYETFEPFQPINDSRIDMSGIDIGNIATITAALLAGGPGSEEEAKLGTWPLILNKDSWFRFLITTLAGAARAGARFKDMPSRGNFTINTKVTTLELNDGLEFPGSQTELAKRLLEQIYAQLDERNDVAALKERAKDIQQKALDHFEWLIRARVAMKCLFISNYFPEGELIEIMERILHEAPKVEVYHDMKQKWLHRIRETEKADGARAYNDAYQEFIDDARAKGVEQARRTANVPTEEHFTRDLEWATKERYAKYDQEVAGLEKELEERFKAKKREREMFYDHKDKQEQIRIIQAEAIALGIIEHQELEEPAPKKVKTSRSSSIVSIRKRGRSASRSKDIAHINLVSYSSTPSAKTKDGSVTPTKASVGGRTPSAIQKEPPAVRMDVDVPVSTAPITISSDTIPHPPEPAVYKPAVPDPIPVESSTRSLASSIHGPGNQMLVDPTPPTSKPSIVEQVSEKFESRFTAIESNLALILATIQKLGQTPAPPIRGNFRPEDRLPNTPRAASKDSLYTNRSHNSATPLWWPGAPEHDEPIYKESDPDPRPVTQQEIDDSIREQADMGLPDEDVLPVAPKPSRKAKQKDAVRRINSKVPGAPQFGTSAPTTESRERIPAEPQVREEVRGHIPVNKPLRPLFSTVTAKSVGEQQGQKPFLNAAKRIQRLPQVQLRAGANSTTEITIIRKGGVDGPAEEEVRSRSPENIVVEVQTALAKRTAHPPKVLSGRWSSRVNITGNFIFLVQGVLDAHQVNNLSPFLCKPFPGDCYAVPSDGWMWAHVRGVPTADANGVVYDNDQLAEALFDNPCFQNLFIPGAPTWLQHPNFVATQDKATIFFAYVDRNNEVTKAATKESVVMFGRQVQFVPVGNKPVTDQCTRCWALGHKNRDCKLAAGVVRCYVCNGSHHGDVHDFECAGKHKTPGVCDCKFKCALCGDTKHNASSIHCPRKAGVRLTKNQWKGIEKRKNLSKEEIFENRTKLAPQAAPNQGKAGKREWTPAQEDMVMQAQKAIFPPCTNNQDMSSALCTCCKVPELSYEDALVCCYANPSREKLDEIESLFPNAAARIRLALRDTGLLAKESSHPSTSSDAPSLSLRRRPVVPPRPLYSRVDDENSDELVEELIDDYVPTEEDKQPFSVPNFEAKTFSPSTYQPPANVWGGEADPSGWGPSLPNPYIGVPLA